MLDTRDEAEAHGAQRELRVDVEPPRDVDRGEEDVAQLREDRRVRLRLGRGLAGRPGERLAKLRELGVEVGERSRRVRVLETDGGGAALHLPRVEEGRERLRHVVEDALALLLLALQLLPAALDCRRGGEIGLTEHVRMPADELLVDAARDGGQVSGPPLLEQEREEDRLEEEVAELVDELGIVGGDRRIRDLVRLLDGVRDDRGRRLRAIPRTVAPQPLGQLLKVDERLLEAIAAAQRSYSVSVGVVPVSGACAPPVSAPPVVAAGGGGSKPGA